jgi:hypothetical protein
MPAVSESLGMRPMMLDGRKGGAGFESLAGSLEKPASWYWLLVAPLVRA